MERRMRFLLCAATMSLVLEPALAAPEAMKLERSNGSVVHYTLDQPTGEAKGLLLIAQGSGCSPGTTNPSMATVRAAFDDHVAVIVEKMGVMPNMVIDAMTDCPAEFMANYTLSQRLSDYRLVLEALAQDKSLPKRLVMFGGSEGGLA